MAKRSSSPPAPVFPAAEPLPARVRVAQQLIYFYKNMTAAQVAIGPLTTEIIDGQKLTSEEQVLRANSAELLTRFMLGELVPDEWDKLVLRHWALHNPENPPRGPEGDHDGDDPPKPIWGGDCPNCRNGPNRPQCGVCHGEGKVAIFPSSMVRSM